MTAQISLQQSTYESTRDIHDVAKDTHEVTANIAQTTKGIAESATDIAHKARDIIVSAFGWITVVQIPTFPLTGSRGPRTIGQAEPRP